MDLKDIDKSSATFWSLGNNPTQKVNSLSVYQVVENLKLLYLLSDKVLAAGSFFFESEITRKVTEKLQKLFEEGEILYFIDEDIENFEEHGAEKVKKSPKSSEAYKDKTIVKKFARQLDSITSPLRRPPFSISDKIVELWIKEIYSEEPETLGAILRSTIKEKDKQVETIISLSKFATERKKDFVWEYLQPFLAILKLNKQFQNMARRRLSQLYSISTAEVLGVSLDSNDISYKNYIIDKTKYDTTLFYECMKILGISKAIQNLNSFDLIKLKSSNEFIYFRELYFSLIDSSSYNLNITKKVLPLLVETESIFSNSKVNIGRFLKSFSKLCSSLRIPSNNYERPLEIILNRYETFNKVTINGFIEIVNETAYKTSIKSIRTTQIADGSDFFVTHQQLIEKIIIEKFQIPKTDAPRRFGEMTEIIIKWFDNFKRSEFNLALSILQNIKYFSEYDVDRLLELISSELKKIFFNDFSNVCIFGLGDSSSASGEQFLYKLRQRLGIAEKHFPKNYKDLPHEINSVVFIDDIIGSGKQATDYYNQNLINLKLDKYYFSLLAFESGISKIKKEAGFKNVFTTKLLTESDKAFSEISELFPDKELRNQIRIIAQSYGEKLYPKGPLGFDDSQALIAFAHNTPNNTLPIIWASVNNEKEIGIPWNPLWERKKVIEKKD